MDVVRTCKRTWRRLGVPRREATEMLAELDADLVAAAEGGVRPEDYVGADLRAFAIEWAEARRLVRPRLRLLSTSAAALVGALPGAGFALFAAYGLSSEAIGDIFGTPVRVGENAYQNYFEPPAWLILGLYALGALFAYAGALASVSGVLAWWLDPARARTQRLLGATLPLGTLGAIAATILFAWTQNFGTSPSVVFADALVAGFAFALFVAGVRVAAVRRQVKPGPVTLLPTT
jgi:Na+-transporting NADH:ubiquinone oxidoreductase subunit NqrE